MLKRVTVYKWLQTAKLQARQALIFLFGKEAVLIVTSIFIYFFLSRQEPFSFPWRQLVQVSVCQKSWSQKRRSLSSSRQEGRQQSIQNTMYVLWLAVSLMGKRQPLQPSICLKMDIFSPWKIYRNIFKDLLSIIIFVLFRCSSQCQAWVPWCLQWTLVKNHFFLIEFNQMPCQCAVCKQCKTFITHLYMCVFFSEDVLPSIHTDPEYPCELVGTWNTWYGEQDQAGKSTVHLWILLYTCK